MHATTVVLVTASEVLQYAAAFFFVAVGIALAYACVRAGNVLGRTEKILDDLDREAVPLLRKSGETLDGVNGSLTNVDEITRDVADMTDKVNGLVSAVDAALQTPAKKAAAFGSGFQQAVSSFLRRDQGAQPGAAADAPPPPAWEAPPASGPAPSAGAAWSPADEPVAESAEAAAVDDAPAPFADEAVAEGDEGEPS